MASWARLEVESRLSGRMAAQRSAEFVALCRWWNEEAERRPAPSGAVAVPFGAVHVLERLPPSDASEALRDAAAHRDCAGVLYCAIKRDTFFDAGLSVSQIEPLGFALVSELAREVRKVRRETFAREAPPVEVLAASRREFDEHPLLDLLAAPEPAAPEFIAEVEKRFVAREQRLAQLAVDIAEAPDELAEEASRAAAVSYAAGLDFADPVDRCVDRCSRRFLLYWAAASPSSPGTGALFALTRALLAARWPRERAARSLLRGKPPEVDVAPVATPPQALAADAPEEPPAALVAEWRLDDDAALPFSSDAVHGAGYRAVRRLAASGARTAPEWFFVATPAPLERLGAACEIVAPREPGDARRLAALCYDALPTYAAAVALMQVEAFDVGAAGEPERAEMARAVALFEGELQRRRPPPAAPPTPRSKRKKPAEEAPAPTRERTLLAAPERERRRGGARVSFDDVRRADDGVRRRGFKEFVELLFGPPDKLYHGGEQYRYAADRFGVTVEGDYEGSWRDYKYGHRHGSKGGPWSLAQLHLYLRKRGEKLSDDVGAAYRVVESKEVTKTLDGGKEETYVKEWPAYARGPDAPEPSDVLRLMLDYAKGEKPNDGVEFSLADEIDAAKSARKKKRAKPKPASPEALADAMAYAKRLWDESTPVCPANESGRYLVERRGLAELGWEFFAAHPYLRHHPALPHAVGDGDDRELFPALLCFATDSEGRCCGGQNVFLERGTGRKAAVSPVKQSWGSLAKTNSFLLVQPGDPARCDYVFLAEGPETALSVAAASPLFRVYAALGLSNLGRFDHGLRVRAQDAADGLSSPRLVLCADDDRWSLPFPRPAESRAATARQVDEGARELRERGWTALVATPGGLFKDFNDLIRSPLGAAGVRASFRLEGGSLRDESSASAPAPPERAAGAWDKRAAMFAPK